ncbi:hypothetical protein [Allokutzneria albata]|nr:hypothetical protein [Allokutzneria albata]
MKRSRWEYATAPASTDLVSGSGTASVTLPDGPCNADVQARSGDITLLPA